MEKLCRSLCPSVPSSSISVLHGSSLNMSSEDCEDRITSSFWKNHSMHTAYCVSTFPEKQKYSWWIKFVLSNEDKYHICITCYQINPTVCHNLNFPQNYFLTSIVNCSGEVLVVKETAAFGFSVFPGYMNKWFILLNIKHLYF